MNTVTIERNRGEPEDYVYAPKDSKERDEKLSFYLETKKGWRVVTLEVVRPYRGFFVNDVGRELDTPFPDSPPKGISACQLLPPPCYESEDDAKKCLPENYPEWFPHIPEHKLEWGTIFQQIHEEALWVKPEHEKKGSLLRNGLAKLRWEARDKRRFEVEAKVKAYKKAYGVKPEAGHEQNTQDELRREADLQLEECKRHWKTIEALPWEDFKRGCWLGEEDSPRDQLLVGEWAERNSIDLTRMAKDRKVCEAWLKETCRNARAFVRDFRHGLKSDLVEEILHFEGNEEESIKALLVRVRYKVKFEDGTLLFLTACEERSLRASEQAEVGGLRPSLRRDR